MHSRKVRKLNMDLPMQPTVDSRPWFAAGLILATAILVMSAYKYMESKKGSNHPQRKESSLMKG